MFQTILKSTLVLTLGFAATIATASPALDLMNGPSISSGVPPAPRAISIRISKVNGAFDERAKQDVLALTAQFLAQGKLIAFGEKVEDDRYVSLCVQVKDYDQKFEMLQAYNALTTASRSVYVSETTACFRELSPELPSVEPGSGIQF